MNTKDICLYNTLSREKDLFIPINKEEVLIYSCGPTVYHYAHIGNLRAYIFADILNNTLKEAGYKIKHQINITDVGHLVSDSDEGEDKMEKGSAREGKSVWDIAEFYTQAFYSDLKDLNIDKEKFIWTRATDYIKEQINMIKELEEKGFTYKTSDGIYFDTSKFATYTELAKINIEGLEKGKRIADEMDQKKNKTDFALWKFSKDGSKRQMEWGSPWGVGFPGWHIECSAMSRAVLGNHLDIHTGGIDHIPVHHTNEIAQSECSIDDGKRFVNYWCHNNFLNADAGKMSKSSGDFLRLESLKEKDISPIAFKYLLLMTHYRKELKFSFESLEAANNAYLKLKNKFNLISTDIKEIEEKDLTHDAKKYFEKFIEAMHDDLNTSTALANIWTMLGDKEIKDEEKYFLLKNFDKYFGLGL
ncbi:MAG: Cysteine--tRNA ligase [Candidatus Parcubacteria bacterium]|jgi:cysteinyl-tRNA synthetase